MKVSDLQSDDTNTLQEFLCENILSVTPLIDINALDIRR